MRSDLPVGLPSLPLVCGERDCKCANPDPWTDGADHYVLLRPGRYGTYEAQVRNEFGDLIDTFNEHDAHDALIAAHREYPLARTRGIDGQVTAPRMNDDPQEMGDDDDGTDA